uniref:SUN domain-containing protein n=1 Tax=Caenorhabditis tropicalis TaxID=1561998 RepID=A0A1I7UWW5_9PELO
MTLVNADIESAYGSDGASSISNHTLKKETFSIQEPKGKEWDRHRIYGLMVAMGIFCLILILLLINSYRMSSKMEETHQIACLDFNCEKTEPLISNCEYKSSGQIQEQIYPIPLNSTTKSIGKVQFRFLKNHGNVKKTCVSLVRVYGQSEDVPKIRENKGHRASCSYLRDTYHNSPFIYDRFEFKTCERLFSNGCCSVCPECCDECYIGSYTFIEYFILSILCFVAGLFGLFVFWCCLTMLLSGLKYLLHLCGITINTKWF